MKYAALVLALLAASCSSTPKSQDAKLTVVANFYPVAEAARRVGGHRVSVTNLTPSGVEPHDLELTSRDVDRIENADVVLYVGSGFQPAVAKAARGRDKPSVDVASGLLGKREGNATDPHFWLDPKRMARAVDAVARTFAAADKGHAALYASNAAAYTTALAALDAQYAATLATCQRHEIVTAHAAFAYMSERYGLTQLPVTGVSPDAEADPQRIADLADLIKRDGVTTVFYEELVPRDFADVLARETGAKAAALSPIEGLTKDEVKAGDDYLSVMRRNLQALAGALACAVAPQ